jgi:hypothetical protein
LRLILEIDISIWFLKRLIFYKYQKNNFFLLSGDLNIKVLFIYHQINKQMFKFLNEFGFRMA